MQTHAWACASTVVIKIGVPNIELCNCCQIMSSYSLTIFETHRYAYSQHKYRITNTHMHGCACTRAQISLKYLNLSCADVLAKSWE